jgi:hypothetical protein
MMCACGSDETHHEMKNKPWVKPGRGGQYCQVPMCSCIQFDPITTDDFFADDVTKDFSFDLDSVI